MGRLLHFRLTAQKRNGFYAVPFCVSRKRFDGSMLMLKPRRRNPNAYNAPVYGMGNGMGPNRNRFVPRGYRLWYDDPIKKKEC